MLCTFHIFQVLTDAFETFVLYFMRAWSCWCALSMCDEIRAEHYPTYTTEILGDVGQEISGYLQWFGAALPQSVKAVGVCGCAEEEGSPKGIAPELQPPKIRNILTFKFQLEDLMSLFLPLCIYLKFSSMNLDKILLLGVWLLPFLNSHCAFPPLKNGLGKLGFFFSTSFSLLLSSLFLSSEKKKKHNDENRRIL